MRKVFFCGLILLAFTSVYAEKVEINKQKISVENLKDSKTFEGRKVATITEMALLKVGRDVFPLRIGSQIEYDVTNDYITRATLGDKVTIRIGNNKYLLSPGSLINFERVNKKTLITLLTPDVDTKVRIGKKSYMALGRKPIFFTIVPNRRNTYISGIYLVTNQEIKVGKHYINCLARGKEDGADVIFNENGRIQSVFLNGDQAFQVDRRPGYMFADKSRLVFSKDVIIAGTTDKNRNINYNGISLPVKGGYSGASSLIFYDNGALKFAMISDASVIEVGGQKLELVPNKYICFYPNKSVKWLYIGKSDSLVAGEKAMDIEAGRKVSFDNKGKIIKISEF